MAQSDWEIREATEADAQEVGDALTEAGVAAWSDFLGEERIREANRDRQHPADLVAEDSEGVFGFVAWDDETGEIQRLHVHPRRWGSGAAEALLDAALAELRATGLTQAWLNTEERNPRAIHFYEKYGWRRDGSVRERDWHGALLREPRFVFDLTR